MYGLKFVKYVVLVLLGACVSQQKYDALEARYNQLNETMSSQITRTKCILPGYKTPSG
jgi:hypothetical protein